MLSVNGKNLEVDSRPSDAIALAVRVKVPMFAEEAVLDKAGIVIDPTTGKPAPVRENPGSEYQVHLTREAAGRDHLMLKVERGEGVEPGRADELGLEVRYVVKHKLRVTPQVHVVAYGALPRSERKSKRVFDTRITDSVV